MHSSLGFRRCHGIPEWHSYPGASVSVWTLTSIAHTGPRLCDLSGSSRIACTTASGRSVMDSWCVRRLRSNVLTARMRFGECCVHDTFAIIHLAEDDSG